MSNRGVRLLLLASVFTIATCGLIYELIAGTVASYLLGDSVTQFSTVIGVYLFAMGVGSWLSRYVDKNLVGTFIQVEFLIALFGGSAAACLFAVFPHINSFRVPLYGIVLVIGTLVGLEIPLLLRLLSAQLHLKDLISKVFTFDYIGALLASLLFPLFLVPYCGIAQTGFIFGILNGAVGMVALWALWDQVPGARLLRFSGGVVLAVLATGFVYSERIISWSEAEAYGEDIIYTKSTPYQRITLTRHGDDLRLYLNGNLQFSSRDEYRYHESLIHPGLARLRQARRILVLGGGDGLAVREILRYPRIQSVTLVDLDPAMTRLFSTQELLTRLNEGAFSSPKVRVINSDAFAWLKQNREKFDFIAVDFPDPSNFSIGKLYTTAFYQRAQAALAADGAMVIQCTSPFVARKSFWCVDETLRASGLVTAPYHVYVPSFGEWGFILASHRALEGEPEFPAGLRFLDAGNFGEMFDFPPDMVKVPVEVNRLNNQALVRYFDEEWGRYLHQ